MKESASNLEFEEAAKIRDEIRKLEASELEITLNPKPFGSLWIVSR